MQISLIYLVLFAFNCIILNICVIELSKSINQSVNFTYVIVIFSLTYRLLIISQFTNCMIQPFYINVFHSFSRCCFHYISCCQIFQLSLSLFLPYSFLVNVGGFQFYEGLCGWKNSNQSVSPWKQAVGLDMAASTKQVKSYLKSKGRRSEPGC